MPTAPSPQPPSFSPGRRWKIGLDLFVRTLLVLAVAVMVNIIGAKFFHRFYLSSQTRVHLSSRTMSVLAALTNHVEVTLYYDRQDDFYPDIVALLDEYQAANSHLAFRTVDPVRDPAEAEKVKERYHLTGTGDKNLVIFERTPDKPSGSVGPYRIATGEALVQYGATGMSKDKKLEFSPVAFKGEMVFTSLLLSLENPRPFKAYFLQGDGEPSPSDTGNYGYSKFAGILQQNNVITTNLYLLESPEVPADCDLLIYIAPNAGVATAPLSDAELQEISQYLKQGGRMLVLLNSTSVDHPTGLGPILQHWGVAVGNDVVTDPENSSSGNVVVVHRYAQHPVVSALAGNGLSLQMLMPRPVVSVTGRNPPADAPKVTELAFSSPDSRLMDNSTAPPRSYPLMAAAEQTSAPSMTHPRGATRLLVAGDSFFLANFPIAYGGNSDFASSAINWLLDRTSLVAGIGPRPVSEFRLVMTRLQQQEIRWMLLGALPGAVLLLGGLVWLARRK